MILSWVWAWSRQLARPAIVTMIMEKLISNGFTNAKKLFAKCRATAIAKKGRGRFVAIPYAEIEVLAGWKTNPNSLIGQYASKTKTYVKNSRSPNPRPTSSASLKIERWVSPWR